MMNAMLAVSFGGVFVVVALIVAALVLGYFFRRNNPKKSAALEAEAQKVRDQFKRG